MSALLESLGIKDRAGVERFIESLIAMLDDMDGDCDLEEGGDLEPTIAGSSARLIGGRVEDDLEDNDDSGIGDGGGLAEQCPGLTICGFTL